MNNKDCPCCFCKAPKRHMGCHGECQEYKDWKVKYAELCKKGKADNEYMGYMWDVSVKKLHKNARKTK